MNRTTLRCFVSWKRAFVHAGKAALHTIHGIILTVASLGIALTALCLMIDHFINSRHWALPVSARHLTARNTRQLAAKEEQ